MIRTTAFITAAVMCAASAFADGPVTGTAQPAQPRECYFALAQLPIKPVLSIRARIEIPQIYSLVGQPKSLATVGHDDAHAEVTITRSPESGTTTIEYSALFSSPANLPPRIFAFVVNTPGRDALPEPLLIRHFSAIGQNGRPLRDVEAEIEIYSVP